MNHIHKNTGKAKITPSNTDTEKVMMIPTLGDKKPILEDKKGILGDQKPTMKRKKTTRSGNSFIRPPKQNLLIMRHRVILRFD